MAAGTAGTRAAAWSRLGAPVRIATRFARRKPTGAIGGFLVFLVLSMAVLAPVLTPHSPIESVARPLQAPSSEYWLGTDSLGRDVLSRVIEGAQVSLVIGITVVILNVGIGTLLGMVSGYFLGWIDHLVQRSGEAFDAFPGIILYFLIISIFGRPSSEGGNMLTIAWDLRIMIFALSVGAVFGGSRVIRGATLSLTQTDFVTAAQAIGAGNAWIIRRHILPNVFPYVLVTVSSSIAGIIIAESALNFLGLGVSAGTPAWGADLANRNRAFFVQAPWLALAPGLALSMTVLGFNLFGDGLRDVLDPRLRGASGGSSTP